MSKTVSRSTIRPAGKGSGDRGSPAASGLGQPRAWPMIRPMILATLYSIVRFFFGLAATHFRPG